MKAIKFLGMMAAAIAVTACTSDDLVNKGVDTSPDKADNVMSFTIKQKNMTRAVTAMEETGHYNFGVFAYKQQADNSYQTVMPNYLVGFKAPNGDKKGYAATSQTYGPSDNLTDATSLWFYENLGTAQYDNQEEGYYKNSDAFYMSNNASQYLKYWDYSANQVEFYAYAPYLKAGAEYEDGKNTATKVTFSDQYVTSPEKKMMFSDIVAGFDEASQYEYMYATTTRVKGAANYNHDVPLTFTRINSKLKLAFYEVIEGYDVEMIEYTVDGNNVQAIGNIIEKGTCVVDFANNPATTTWTGTLTEPATLNFNIPVGNAVTADACHNHGGYNRIANVKNAATENHPLTKGCLQDENSQSSTVYYCLPDVTNDGTDVKNGDLTFHMSFNLHSLDTDEIITVKNATVVVPTANTQWESNKVYTYIFKITKDANGSTGNPDDPNDPAGLYPIVFDGIQVVDYQDEYTEWDVSQLVLSQQLMTLKNPVDGAAETDELVATLFYEDGTAPTTTEVTWKTDDANVAKINISDENATGTPLTATATIEAVAAGSADITVSAVTDELDGTSGKNETAVCRVTVPLQLKQKAIALKYNQNYNIADVFKTNAPDGATLTWKEINGTSNLAMNATIIRSKVNGSVSTVEVTYVDGKGVKHTDTCLVYTMLNIFEGNTPVPSPVEKESGSTSVWTVNMPDKLEYSSTPTPVNVTWSSNNTKVVTVDQTSAVAGNVPVTITGVAAGVARITVAGTFPEPTAPTDVDQNIAASAVRTVTVPLQLDYYDMTLAKVGDENIINILNLPEGIKASKITWESSNTAVAAVTVQPGAGVVFGGIVKAKASGEATITAKYEYATGKYLEKSCTVTVK